MLASTKTGPVIQLLARRFSAIRPFDPSGLNGQGLSHGDLVLVFLAPHPFQQFGDQRETLRSSSAALMRTQRATSSGRMIVTFFMKEGSRSR